METNPMMPPQAPPVKVDPLTGKLVPANMPPPSPAAIGMDFQRFASFPENAAKIQASMTHPWAPLQPNAGSAAANPPPMAPMASAMPPGSFGAARAAAQPLGAEPSGSLNLPASPSPIMASSAPPVTTTATPGQLQTAADTTELQRLQQTGAGVNQIKNPVLRTLGQIGNIAAPFLLGRGAMAVPGTSAHNMWLQGVQQGRVGQDQAAQAADLAQQTGLAGLAETQARTKAIGPEQQRQQAELDVQLATHGMAMGPDGKITQLPPEQWSPEFRQAQELQQAQIYGLKNPWAKLPGNEPVSNLDQVNKGFADIWNVQHPNTPVPAAYQLPQGAVKNDYDRIDKLLTQSETALATKAQRDTSNEMRRQTMELARQGADLRAQTAATQETSKNLKWVMGRDASGRQVAGPLSMAEREKWQDMAELPSPEVKDVYNARQAITLATKVGDEKQPETMGVLQLIDSLDKDGKLGVASSRLNKLLTEGLGAAPNDDPRIAALLNKSSLFTTGVMLAHFGASGGRSPQMLQHFTALADAGKMDAPTLKAGTKALVDYMQDRAMLPGAAGGAPKQAAPAGASQEVYKDGKLIGHVVKDAFVPIGGK